MTRKTIEINKNTLDRLSKIFPNVVWKDYTNHYGKELSIEIRKKLYKKLSSKDKVGYSDINTDSAFHIILNKIVDSALKNDIDIINEFYKFKQSQKKNSNRAKIFDYLLPPEKDFFSVASSTSTNYITTSGGIYFFFNKYFIEKKFEDNLSTDLQVHLNNGTNFPLNKAFNENMKEWLCYYDNDKPRFHWDIKEKEKINFGHNPNVPWKAFQNRCQYAYTLVKIGYEQRDLSKPNFDKSTYQEEGVNLLCNFFKLEEKKQDYNSRIKKSVEYDESDYCILKGNIFFGIETSNNKDSFSIKDYEKTKKDIIIAIRHRKYEQSAEIFDFTDSDIRSIYRIYDANQSRLDLPPIPINNGKEDFKSAFDVLNKRRVLLNDTDKKRIEEIAEKIAIKNPIPQSKKKNEIENEYDCTDEVAYEQWEDEKNKLDEQSQLKELAECFCAEFPNDEKKFTNWIKATIEEPDGIRIFADELNMLESKEDALKSKIVTKYSELLEVTDITLVIRLLRTAKENAQNRLKEKYEEI